MSNHVPIRKSYNCIINNAQSKCGLMYSIIVTVLLLSSVGYLIISEITCSVKWYDSNNRRGLLISDSNNISAIPPYDNDAKDILPGISWFNKIYNMFDGTDLLEKSGRDFFTFRYSESVQTLSVGDLHSYFVPVEFANIPNIFPQCYKDTSLSELNTVYNHKIMNQKTQSKTSTFLITLEQIGAILGPIMTAITGNPAIGNTITSITSSKIFKDTTAMMENVRSSNTKTTRLKKESGYQKVFTISSETSLYKGLIAIDQIKSFKLKFDFIEAVQNLESNLNNNTILEFIYFWGTHIIRSARMGAMCQEYVYVQNLNDINGYSKFYTYTNTKKRGILFWSSSTTTTHTMSESGIWNQSVRYEFTNIKCEGECPTSQKCGTAMGSANYYFLKPIEYELVSIWAIDGLLSMDVQNAFQMFIGIVMKELFLCRLNHCNNAGICSLKEDVFTLSFVYGWDGITFSEIIDYEDMCYCEDHYHGDHGQIYAYIHVECDEEEIVFNYAQLRAIFQQNTPGAKGAKDAKGVKRRLQSVNIITLIRDSISPISLYSNIWNEKCILVTDLEDIVSHCRNNYCSHHGYCIWEEEIFGTEGIVSIWHPNTLNKTEFIEAYFIGCNCDFIGSYAGEDCNALPE